MNAKVSNALFYVLVISGLVIVGCGGKKEDVVKACTTNADCSQGYVCQNGECVGSGADTTPPDTSITSNPPNPTNSTSATFTFTSTEGGSTFECQLDAGGYSACTSPKNYTGLSAGSHTFEVRATDAAGNTDPTPASYTWTIVPSPCIVWNVVYDGGSYD